MRRPYSLSGDLVLPSSPASQARARVPAAFSWGCAAPAQPRPSGGDGVAGPTIPRYCDAQPVLRNSRRAAALVFGGSRSAWPARSAPQDSLAGRAHYGGAAGAFGNMEAAGRVSTDQGSRFTLRVVTVRPGLWLRVARSAQNCTDRPAHDLLFYKRAGRARAVVRVQLP